MEEQEPLASFNCLSGTYRRVFDPNMTACERLLKHSYSISTLLNLAKEVLH